MAVFFKKAFQFTLVCMIVAGWMFSGWPPVWNDPSVPPKIKEAQAATLNSESFESATANDTAWNNSNTTWDNASGDDCDWFSSTDGSTPSSGTGPDTFGAQNGSVFIYIETSSGAACNGRSFTAILEYESTLDADTYTDITVDFYNHMLGGQIGTLYLDVNQDGGGWTNVWSRGPGTQGDQWNSESVDLTAAGYTSGSLQVRLRAVHTGSTFQGDISVDNITVSGTLANASPAAPTLSDAPFDNEKTGDSTPDFKFTASDPDGSAGITYQIQIDDDNAFGSALVDCPSDGSCTTGAGSFSRSGDSDPFTEGQEVTFTPTTAMTTNTTYYWRVRAKDASGEGGSGNYGSWSDIHSVTFISGTSPSEWYQATDEQFNTGTLSDVETSGSDSVQLSSGQTIQIDTANISTGDGTSGPVSFSHTVASNSNRILIVGVQAESAAGTAAADTCAATSVTFNTSESLTLANNSVNLDDSGADQCVSIWYLLNPTATTATISVSFAGTIVASAVGAMVIYNAAQQAPVDTNGTSALSNPTSISTSVTTTSGDLVVSVVGNGNDDTGMTPQGSAAERWQLNDGGGTPTATGAGSSLSASGSSTSIGWDASGANRLALSAAAFGPATISSGTVMSGAVDYDWVLGATSWGAAAFSTTETNGDVKVGFYYNNGSDCDTIIPDGALSGNSSGFDVSASPVDLSGLNTTTYNRICLRATLTDSGGTPFLNDWTVMWSTTSVSAPAVTTSAASSITTSSATLNGSVTDNGGEDASTCGFSWGTNSALSGGDTATTTDSTCPSGTGSFTKGLSSLSDGTTYYFRAYATNSGGSGYGSIQNFSTDALVYSVTVTTSGTVEYGFVEIGTASSTVGNGYTQTAQNDGNTIEKLNVKSSDATGGTTWTLGTSIGSDQYKHEFSTTTGSTWTAMPDNATYVTVDPSVAQNDTVDFDFRLTTPSASSDYQQKSITITVQAVAP